MLRYRELREMYAGTSSVRHPGRTVEELPELILRNFNRANSLLAEWHPYWHTADQVKELMGPPSEERDDTGEKIPQERSVWMSRIIIGDDAWQTSGAPDVIRVGTACYRWLGETSSDTTATIIDEARDGCDCPCDACCEDLYHDLLVTVEEVTACSFAACGPEDEVPLRVAWIDDCLWEDDWIDGPVDCFYWVRVDLDCDPPGKWKMDISLFGGECGCSEENGNPLELLKGTSPMGPWPDGHCGQGGLAVSFEGITVAEVSP
jgi:hypothetical protein